MAEESDAIQHSHISGAEEQADETRGKRHGREPKQPHGSAENVSCGRIGLRQDEGGNGDGPEKVDRGQQHLLGQAGTKIARQQ